MIAADHLLALALALALPLLNVARNPRIRRDIEAGVPGRKLRDYCETLVELWLQGLAVAALWLATGRDWALLGLAPPRGPAFWVAALLLMALTAFGVYQYRAIRRSPATQAMLRERMAHLAWVLADG